MSHIFISHASIDAPLALAFANALSEAGYQTWASNRDIGPGSEWGKEIDRALVDAHTVLVVCTSASVASSYVRAEVEFAISSQKLTIPILSEEVDLPIRWKSLQWIALKSAGVKPTIDELLHRLPQLPFMVLEGLLNGSATFEELRSYLVYGNLAIFPARMRSSRDHITDAGLIDIVDVGDVDQINKSHTDADEYTSETEEVYAYWQFLPPHVKTNDKSLFIPSIEHAATCVIADFGGRKGCRTAWLSLRIVIGRREDAVDDWPTARGQLQQELSQRAWNAGFRNRLTIMSYDRLVDMARNYMSMRLGRDL